MSGCDFSASMQEPETNGSSYYRVGFVFEDRMLRLMGAVEIGDLARTPVPRISCGGCDG